MPSPMQKRRRPPEKGSMFRPDLDGGHGYRSVIAYAGSDATSLADGASSSITVPITEQGLLGKLVITSNAAVALVAGAGQNTGIYVTSIKVNNDELLGSASGAIPAELFCRDAAFSPAFGHKVRPNDAVSVTVKNQSGAVAEVGVAFTAF